jgi:hypothetical protein
MTIAEWAAVDDGELVDGCVELEEKQTRLTTLS